MLDAPTVTDKAVTYTFVGRSDTERTRLIILDKTVLVSEEQFMHGVNKHSGAPWERWASLSTAFYSLKQERENVPLLKIYRKTKKRKGRLSFVNNTPISLTSLLDDVSPQKPYNTVIIASCVMLILTYKYAAVTGTVLPVTSEDRQRMVLSMAYPVVKFFEQMTPKNIASGIKQNSPLWCGTTDIKEYIRKSFGVGAVRRDMIKALTTLQNPVALETLSLFRRLVPVDWIIMLLRDQKNYGLTQLNYPLYGVNHKLRTSEAHKTLKMFFGLLNEYQKKKLFRAKTPVRYENFKDTLDMLRLVGVEKLEEEINSLNLSNWEALHDSLSKLQRRLAHAPKNIPQDKTMKALDGGLLKIGDKVFVVKSPKMTNELIEWGDQLNNCIASYASSVLQGHTRVFAVYDEKEKLTANVEFRDKYIVQFMENYNKPVAQEMLTAFERLLAEKKITVTPKADRSRGRQHGRQRARQADLAELINDDLF